MKTPPVRQRSMGVEGGQQQVDPVSWPSCPWDWPDWTWIFCVVTVSWEWTTEAAPGCRAVVGVGVVEAVGEQEKSSELAGILQQSAGPRPMQIQQQKRMMRRQTQVTDYHIHSHRPPAQASRRGHHYQSILVVYRPRWSWNLAKSQTEVQMAVDSCLDHDLMTGTTTKTTPAKLCLQSG
jgi:hypothetical protein